MKRLSIVGLLVGCGESVPVVSQTMLNLRVSFDERLVEPRAEITGPLTAGQTQT